jgi:hypothetical protein
MGGHMPIKIAKSQSDLYRVDVTYKAINNRNILTYRTGLVN